MRGGEGARGTSRGMQGLQLLRPGEDKLISPNVHIPNNIKREITSFSGLPHDPDPPSPRGGHPRRGFRLLHLGDGDRAVQEGHDGRLRGPLPAGGGARQVRGKFPRKCMH